MLTAKQKQIQKSDGKQKKRKLLAQKVTNEPEKKKRKISKKTKQKKHSKENKPAKSHDTSVKKQDKQPKLKSLQDLNKNKKTRNLPTIGKTNLEAGWLMPLVNKDVDGTLEKTLLDRINGANFRLLNEQLYSHTGKESFDYFSKNPALFNLYHEGYRSQIQKWPVKPVYHAISWLRANLPQKSVIADFGCGDAALAKTLCPKYTVHSFDLVAPNEYVTACDMANVPLENSTVDAAVFCLALMGKNFNEFLKEAHRVLKVGGHIWIAEVTSRVTDYRALTKTMEALGCKQERLKKGEYFFEAVFEKTEKPPKHFLMRKEAAVLKPSLYKKR